MRNPIDRLKFLNTSEPLGIEKTPLGSVLTDFLKKANHRAVKLHKKTLEKGCDFSSRIRIYIRDSPEEAECKCLSQFDNFDCRCHVKQYTNTVLMIHVEVPLNHSPKMTQNHDKIKCSNGPPMCQFLKLGFCLS